MKGLSYQYEDEYDDFIKKLKKVKSYAKKQIMLNNKINREFFYYNPIYTDLLKKKN